MAKENNVISLIRAALLLVSYTCSDYSSFPCSLRLPLYCEITINSSLFPPCADVSCLLGPETSSCFPLVSPHCNVKPRVVHCSSSIVPLSLPCVSICSLPCASADEGDSNINPSALHPYSDLYEYVQTGGACGEATSPSCCQISCGTKGEREACSREAALAASVTPREHLLIPFLRSTC